jgi:hypothetical protein
MDTCPVLIGTDVPSIVVRRVIRFVGYKMATHIRGGLLKRCDSVAPF